MTEYYRDDQVTLYHADCLGIMPTLGRVDHIITDPPYSERTHEGHRATQGGNAGFGYDNSNRQPITYTSLTPKQCKTLAAQFCAICDGWIVWMTDHTLAPVIMDTLESHGRYVFAPLPFYAPGSRVRLCGDGPSSWTIWIIVARTKAQLRWGTLPGGYLAGPGWRDSAITGGKPLALMSALVSDYSRDGDLILDPFCGAGTTCHAAKNLGRRSIGIDIDSKHIDLAAKRCSQEVLAL